MNYRQKIKPTFKKMVILQMRLIVKFKISNLPLQKLLMTKMILMKIMIKILGQTIHQVLNIRLSCCNKLMIQLIKHLNHFKKIPIERVNKLINHLCNKTLNHLIVLNLKVIFSLECNETGNCTNNQED